MRTYGGVEVNDQLHAPNALSPGKCFRYPFCRRLCEPWSRSERCGEEKSLSLAGNQTQTVQLVAVLTELGMYRC